MTARATLHTVGALSHRCAIALAALLVAWPHHAAAHDLDAFGGLVRTHDAGVTWTPVNPGVFPTGALALAISPRDTNHLLLATDSGVWRSRNGGRDWDVEARDLVTGAAFAVAFDVDGERALIAGVSGLFGNEANRWRPIRVPAAAAPVRALVAGVAPAQVFLAGRYGLYRSDDWGRSWVDVAGSFKSAPVDALLVSSGDAGAVYALVSGSVWSSVDGAKTWQQRSEGLGGEGKVETLGIDPSNPARLWVVAASNVLVSEDRGASWQPRGNPVPEAAAKARAIAVSGDVMLVVTDRGVFRSADGGQRWEALKENLPAHLAVGVLVRDARAPATLYAGFAVMGYDELRARARQDEGVFARMGAVGIAGGAALALLALALVVAARYRIRLRSRNPALAEARAPTPSIDPAQR